MPNARFENKSCIFALYKSEKKKKITDSQMNVAKWRAEKIVKVLTFA